MAKDQSTKAAANESTQSSAQQQQSNIENRHLPKAKPEELAPFTLQKLARNLTNKVNPSVKIETSSSNSQASTEEKKKRAGLKIGTPRTREGRLEKTGFDKLEQVVGRARTSQRTSHDLEDPRVEDPMSGEGMGERERAEEMKKKRSKGQRFQTFLEEYL